MFNLLTYMFFTVLCSICEYSFCIDDPNNTQDISQIEAQDEFPAPNYDALLPIKQWNRQTGDSAKTVGEWKRWWTYLRLKKPVVMKWIDGLKLRIYPGNEVFRALFVRGIYDPNVVVAINALLPKDGVFIDVGANMGYCSLLADRIVGEDGKIFAIEPSERDFLRLLDNVSINKLRNINSYRLVISDKEGEALVSIAPEERSALNTVATEFNYKGIEKIKTEKVPSTTIDIFVDKEGLDKIDVIKMDIESSELSALKGAKNSIEKYRPAIILGFNKNAFKTNHISCEEIEKILSEHRYIIYSLVEEPTFAFKEIKDLSNYNGKIIFCLHESLVPPTLPQPIEKDWSTIAWEFFMR